MKRTAWILGAVGILCLAAFILYRLVAGSTTTFTGALGGVGVLLILAWLLLDRKQLGLATGTRAFRMGTGALVLALLALGVAVVVNVLAVRWDHRWDLTSSNRYTLSEQSVKVAANLDQQVQVLAFFQAGSPEEQGFRDLLAGYQQHTGLLQAEYHDPLREPFLAQQQEVTTEYGTVILTAGEARQRLESDFGEEALTNALIRVTAGEEHVVCFTTEHGEWGADDDQNPWGLGLAVQKLEGQNYTVENVSLLQEGGVPARCEVLVVVAPEVDLLPVEREAVARYVRGGGGVFFLLEPVLAEATAADLARYGISLRQDLVVEDNPQARAIGFGPTTIFVAPGESDFHPITDGLKGGLLFQDVRSVSRREDAPEGLAVQVLIRTSPASWAETRLEGAVQPDEGEDLIANVPIFAVAEVTDPEAVPVGEVELAPARADLVLPGQATGADAEAAAEADAEAAAEADAEAAAEADAEAPAEADAEAPAEADAEAPAEAGKAGRVVVSGDASFATNQLLLQVQNQDLFLNTIAWLVGEEDQVSIRPNEAAAGTLQMNLAQTVVVWFVALLLIPGIAVVGAVSAWLRRRRM